MEVKNCMRCRKIFQYLSGPPLCPNCKDEDEKDFQRVKDFLREHPRASITEVAETLEVSVDKITRFLRDGRLEIAPGSPIILECERCGSPITSGRFCALCSNKMGDDLKDTSRQLRERSMQTSQSMMKYLRKEE